MCALTWKLFCWVGLLGVATNSVVAECDRKDDDQNDNERDDQDPNEPLASTFLVLASFNNLLVGFRRIQYYIIHFLISAHQLLSLFRSIHVDLVCNRIDVLHQSLSLVKHVRTFIDLRSVVVNFVL